MLLFFRVGGSIFFLPQFYSILIFLTLAVLPPYNVAFTTAHGRMYRSVTSVTAEAELCAVCNCSVAEPSALSKDPEAVDAKWYIPCISVKLLSSYCTIPINQSVYRFRQIKLGFGGSVLGPSQLHLKTTLTS